MKLVHFYQKLTVWKPGGSTFTVICRARAPHRILIEHTNTYTAKGTPGNTEITVHNLTKSHANLFKKGARARLTAGWYNADDTAHIIHEVTDGKISSVTPPATSDADLIVNFNIADGQKYDAIKAIKVKKSKRVRVRASQKDLDKAISKYNSGINAKRKKWIDEHPKASRKEVRAKNAEWLRLKKNYATNARSSYNKQRKALDNKKKYQVKTVYEFMSFKKNTKGSTIVKKVAKKAGIKLAAVHLNYDRTYTNGYTAKAKPMKVIEQIASDCDTDIIYRYAKIYLERLDSKRKKNLYIEYSTGLLSEPEYQADDDSKVTQWQVTFLYRSLAVGDVFHLKSRAVTGWVIVMSGSNAYQSGSAPTTQVVVELYSDYKKTLTKKINAKKKSDRAAKAKADKKAKAAAKKKRTARAKDKKNREMKLKPDKDKKDSKKK